MSKSYTATINRNIRTGKYSETEMDVEEEVEVFYTMSPADPDTGILRAWPEIDIAKDSAGREYELCSKDEERILERIAEREEGDD